MSVWYSYDPEDGYSTHASAEEAREGADASLEYHRGRSTDGWHENTRDIEWGLLVPFGEARECQRRETPGGDFDYICDYQLVSAPGDDPLEQAYRRMERSTDWHEQRYAAVRAWVESEVRPISEEVARHYYSVVANGTPCPYQPADWSSTVHGLTLRAEKAEKERDGLQAEAEADRRAVVAYLRRMADMWGGTSREPGDLLRGCARYIEHGGHREVW